MDRIYKYEILITDEQRINIPVNAEILSCQVQKGKPCIWVKLNTNDEVGIRIIRVIGTGHPIGSHENLKFIDTIQINDGDLVFHVFEIK